MLYEQPQVSVSDQIPYLYLIAALGSPYIQALRTTEHSSVGA